MIKRVLKLQSIVIKYFSFLWFFLLRHFRIYCIPRLFSRASYCNVRKLLVCLLARYLSLSVHLKSSFDPFLLVRIRSSSNHVLLSPCHACLNIVAIGKWLPIVEVIYLHWFAFWSHKYAHIVLSIFVASATSDSRFCKVHNLKSVRFILDTALGSEVKPLLMSSRVCINLHE